MNSGDPVLGLVGCGEWGKLILRDLVSLGATVEVVARSGASRARAEEFGAARIVGDIAGLGDLDGVVVATPTSTHAAVLWEVLDRDVPVFVEKPMVMQPGEADALAASAGGRLFVMDKWRYHPGIQKLGEIVAAGRLGAVTRVHTRRLGWGNNHPDVDVVWTHTPHDLAIVLEILGEIPPARAAVGEVFPGGAADFTGWLGDGPVVVIDVSARHPARDRSVRVHGTDAVAVLADPYASSLIVAAGHDPEGPVLEEIEISTEWPLLRELRAFVNYLRGGPPPRSSAAEGAVVVHRLARLRALAGLDA